MLGRAHRVWRGSPEASLGNFFYSGPDQGHKDVCYLGDDNSALKFIVGGSYGTQYCICVLYKSSSLAERHNNQWYLSINRLLESFI